MSLPSEAVEANWGRQIFDRHYITILNDLFAAFAASTGATVCLYIDKEPIFVVPEGGHLPICRLLREAPWSAGRCAAEDTAQSDLPIQADGAPVRHTCWLGLDNYVCSFEVPGLGKVTIVYARIPPAADSGTGLAARPDDEAQSEIAAALAEVLPAQPPAPAVLAANLDLFRELTQTVKALCGLGIDVHLRTRSSLHELSLSLAATRGAADYIIDKAQDQLWVDNPRVRPHVITCVSAVSDHTQLANALAGNV